MTELRNTAIGPQVRLGPRTRRVVVPILAIGSLFLGLQAATQYFAFTFGYQEVLGAHVQHVYPPWSMLVWAHTWFTTYPDQIQKAGAVGIVVTAGGLLCLVIARIIQDSTPRANPYLHGSARWANREDIERAALLPRSRSWWDRLRGQPADSREGVYVGAWLDPKNRLHYLRHNGPEHVLTYAPTRSGKGVSLVIPTLLSWPHSAVITDLKGELWTLTAGWRQQHAKNKVLRFEPAALEGSVRWNPLDEIRVGTEHEVGDVQNLTTMLVDPDGKGLESHWQKTSQALLVGVILHALYTAKKEGATTSLPAVDAMLSNPSRSIAELWMEMSTSGHVNGEVHPIVASAARDMMDRPEEEAGSVLSTAKSYLALYRDPVVAKNVSTSEFKIRDLMHHERPVSLYLVTMPNDKARLRPLVRLLLTMVVRMLSDTIEVTRSAPTVSLWDRLWGTPVSPIRQTARHKHRLLGMIDEFPSLGKLDILQESLAFMAGYGMKFYLICQDINQLKSREIGYGPDETITSNCHVQNAFPPNRIETAEHLSRLTGQTTVVKEQITSNARYTGWFQGHVSRTTQEVQRPLLTPDECLRMPGPQKDSHGQILEPGDMVIYVAGFPAIYGRQPLYFHDPIFSARAAVPPPTSSDMLRQGREAQPTVAIKL
jgi:type IV secretion system protein VirD4